MPNPTITTAWMTTHGLRLQSYSRTQAHCADWLCRSEELPFMTEAADAALDRWGYRRSTPWVFCPIKTDGMTASIVRKDA